MKQRFVHLDDQSHSHLNSAVNIKHSKQQDIQQAQEVIYQFILERVNTDLPNVVLSEFEGLFFSLKSQTSREANRALEQIVLSRDEATFRTTLKRSCYILLNNWSARRNHEYNKKLIQGIAEAGKKAHSLVKRIQILRQWLENFIASEDYYELRLYAFPYPTEDSKVWSDRYTSYLLVPHYLDSNNSIEQREIARALSKQMKEQFKFNLAMYTARCDDTRERDEDANPTLLGNDVIRLIKKVISRKSLFNHENYANIFLQQVRNSNFLEFKKSLQRYLLFSLEEQELSTVLEHDLSQKIANLYSRHNSEELTINLFLRTCRRLIEFLTTENGKEPSEIFTSIAAQGNPLTLAIALLKIILICKYANTHLDYCVATLIRYYRDYPEEDCQWFINFLEIFKTVFAIYTANIQYDLVKIKDSEYPSNIVNLDAYRLFPQLKGTDLRGTELRGADLRSTNLSAADLRGVDLAGAKLKDVDLSLAKLTGANLSYAELNWAQLTAAELTGVDLSHALLNYADISRANLKQANLNRASLRSAQLRSTDLQDANLSNANLSHASLNGTNFRGADLSGANLRSATLNNVNLSGANLTKANLQGVDLRTTRLDGANLSGANLSNANLEGANLRWANLSGADLNRANLRHTNLKGANLSGASVRHLTLEGTDLSHANLSKANLFKTDLTRAKVNAALLSNNPGLSKETLFALKEQGAFVINTDSADIIKYRRRNYT